MSVRAVDPSGAVYDGQLVEDRLDAHCDYTLACMWCSGDIVNPFHNATGSYPPLVVRTSTPRETENVAHWSSLRGRRMLGTIRHISTGFTYVPGYGSQGFPYRDIFVVTSVDPLQPFGVAGDSGSLVVDGKNRVIGTVVAGHPAANISYVLPIKSTVGALGAYADRFFQLEDN
jgi:hypothetical protein